MRSSYDQNTQCICRNPSITLLGYVQYTQPDPLEQLAEMELKLDEYDFDEMDAELLIKIKLGQAGKETHVLCKSSLLYMLHLTVTFIVLFRCTFPLK